MDAPNDLFCNAKLRIERANKHIAELNDVLNAFLNSDFYDFRVEPNTHPRFPQGTHSLFFRTTKKLPKVGPVIGDALHNLRVPLDYVAAELIRRSNGTPDNYTKFPFGKNREKLIAGINGGQIKIAPKTVIDVIIDEIKPYPGGNDALYALHTLDIDDKHFDFIPMVQAVGVEYDAVIKGRNIVMNKCRAIMIGRSAGGDMPVVSFPGDQDIQGNAHPIVNIGFGKGEPFEGQPVIPTLARLSKLVASAVNAIENAWVASVKPTS